MYKRQYVARQYTILNAVGGLGGSTFGALVNNNLPSSVTSVSYTHLRAHETVLDLVCRLLLENKKPSIDNHFTLHRAESR